MSQVGLSRPATQMSGINRVGQLPSIEHPMSRVSNPDDLGVVRGLSRAGAVDRSFSAGQGRPLANETVFTPRKSFSAAGRESRQSRRFQINPNPPVSIEAIPEGVEVTFGDPDKPKIPIFGNRADLGSRGEVVSRGDVASRASSRLSKASAQARLEIDELEMMLKEKVRGNFFEVKKRFKDNDPEGKGNVTREALFRILVTLLNRPMSQNIFIRLLERLGFRDRHVISVFDFYAVFREPMDTEHPRWMDPIHRHWQDKVSMTASQVHAQLKEKARQRFLDVADLIPQMNPDGSGHILKPELRNVLQKMSFKMEDDEFEKLWQRYDTENIGTINGEKFLNALGISLRDGSVHQSSSGRVSRARQMKKSEMERKHSLDIEKWLKSKFREGFMTMKTAFEELDVDKAGVVNHDGFLDVLANNGLKMEKNMLPAFLSRCAVEIRREGVPYREFLHRFQDRGEEGMTHKIMTDRKHRFNTDIPTSAGGNSSLSAIESQLMNMFQRDFLALLGFFQRLDRFNLGYVSQEEFRAAMESRFGLELSEVQFDCMKEKLPLDEDGNVKYREFMKQFDTKGVAPSLFNSQPANPDILPEEDIREDPELEAIAESPEPHPVDEDPLLDEVISRRTPRELFRVIKDLLRRKFQEVEEMFYQMDDRNTQRMSQESMYQLLKKFDIHPEITRGEIRDLWKTFITNTDKTLDYLQFIRHFGYSLKSAAFPNAKTHPPKRGDADYMLRSRKLNCAADMIQDTLRSKIEYMWEDLRKEFVEMDLYGTGFVSEEEFRDVLSELCVHLSQHELNMLTRKFDIKKDGRVSYIDFLKPFAIRKQTWRSGNDMGSLLQHPQPELPITDIVEPPQKGLHGITSRLRQKVAGEWKNLRRAFRKLDINNNGYLSVPEFRSVLKLMNVILTEDDVYHLMNVFDEAMSGTIPYEKFINEIFKPETRQSVRIPAP
ncbi:EF-hand calcium-binding domain-containing protein 6-like isoform X2 [Liolophura sinensis]